MAYRAEEGINIKNNIKLLLTEMDFWRRSASCSKLQKLEMKNKNYSYFELKKIIMTCGNKQLWWFGYSERMHKIKQKKKVWRGYPLGGGER